MPRLSLHLRTCREDVNSTDTHFPQLYNALERKGPARREATHRHTLIWINATVRCGSVLSQEPPFRSPSLPLPVCNRKSALQGFRWPHLLHVFYQEKRSLGWHSIEFNGCRAVCLC